jgi:2,4-dienoyl-CoA reductase-like NADH-dependent reductase (Old Yellow Enzyme family)
MSEMDLDVLFRPVRIRSLEIPNRIMVSAHQTSAEMAERYPAYLAERARGGAGLIVTGAMSVHPSTDGGWFLGWQPQTIEACRRISDAVHAQGGRVFAQLHHFGLQGLPAQTFDGEARIVAPSSVPSPVYDQQGHALRVEEIAEIVEHFALSAEHAQAGGMDGVEVHAAHGYLLHSFLSPLTNKRTDEYGGSAENRARFVIEALRAVRERVGDDYPVGLKIAFDEFVGPLALTPDTASETLRLIHAQGLFDYLSISGAGYHSLLHLIPPQESGLEGHLAPYGAVAKQIVGDRVPVMVTCGVRTVERAAAIVGAGQADVVGMVRAHLADPEIVKKARSGRATEIRPCVGANQGCWRRVYRAGHATCTVNPEAGRELEWKHFFDEVATPGRVLIVGGGPAGLKAAESAARRGHDVVLLEREPALGGQLRAAGLLPQRGRWLRLIEHFEASLQRLGVEVCVGVEATVDTPGELQADVTVVASGASWRTDGYSVLRPDRETIPGLPSAHVVDPITAITNPATCGRRVLIVDDHGIYLALGIAELLAQNGCEVEFVTAHPQVGIQAGVTGTVDYAAVYPRLVQAGVSFSTETTVQQIDGRAVSLAHVYGGWTRRLEDVDAIVLCQLRRPRHELHDELLAAKVTAEIIGDAYAPREVDDAILEGARSALAVVPARRALTAR